MFLCFVRMYGMKEGVRAAARDGLRHHLFCFVVCQSGRLEMTKERCVWIDDEL
jgi:hypothetical protein